MSHHTFAPRMLNPSARDRKHAGRPSRTLVSKQESHGYSYFFFYLVTYFIRCLPNYFPGQLCPAVPFCNRMEGSLKIRTASKSTEMPRKATARTSLGPWDHGSGAWCWREPQADGLWANFGCLKVSWSVAPAFLGFPWDDLGTGLRDCLPSCMMSFPGSSSVPLGQSRGDLCV